MARFLTTAACTTLAIGLASCGLEPTADAPDQQPTAPVSPTPVVSEATPAPPVAETPPPPPAKNLLSNPGFEEGMAGWQPNNWNNLKAEFAIEEGGAHSGDKCVKVQLLENKKGTNIQFFRDLSKIVKPGDSLRIGLWIKGTDNSAPMDIGLSQAQAPWKDYLLVPIVAEAAWRYHEVYWTVGDDVDIAHLRLQFYVRDEMTVYLDDIILSHLPAQHQGPPLAGNLVRNGSFEFGRDRWYFCVAPHGAWNKAETEAEAWDTFVDWEKPTVRATDDATDGNNALHLNVGKHMRGIATSAYFELRYGHPVTVRFDLRSDKNNVGFRANINTTGGYSQRTIEGRDFRTAKQGWSTHSFTFTPKPSNQNLYTFEIFFFSPGNYEIDNLVINEGDTATDPAFVGSQFGWTLDNETPGHLYRKNEALALNIQASNPQRRSLKGTAKVIDYAGQAVTEQPFTVELDATGAGTFVCPLPTDRFGAFKLLLTADTPTTPGVPDLEWCYQVLPPLPPLKSVTDHFFGGHSPLTPDALWVAEKVGMRSIRMHPPLTTKWRALEVAPGQWEFDKARNGFKRARAIGFDLLGSLDTSPDFHAGLPDPKPARFWMGYGNYPPKDLSQFGDYVKRTVTAFAGEIDNWEVWNEPDNHFLEGPTFPATQGKTKPELYHNLVKQARRGLEASGQRKTLVAGAVAALEKQFTRDIIERNVAADADIFSFHMYGGTVSPARLDLIRAAQALPGRHKRPVPVWQTEGAYFPTIVTWLDSARIPEAKPELAQTMVDNTVVRMVQLKAIGVERNYHYPEPFRTLTGREIFRNEFACGWDVAGNPLPLWAAHAACVLFLEGAAPVGSDVRSERIDDTTVYRAVFSKNNKPVEIWWASQPIATSKVPALPMDQAVLYDTMGNPLAKPAFSKLTPSPVYLISQ